MIRILFSFVTVVFFSLAAVGQITFTKQQGPTGASIGDIEVNSSAHIFIYAGTSNGNQKPVAGSVYRSTNGGTDWIKISTGTNGLNDNDAYDILIDAADNIYVLGKTKIYKSMAASNGDAWTSFTPPSPFESGSKLAKTTNGNLYLYNAFSGVFKSVDDGATWTNITNNLPNVGVNYLDILSLNNDVYVGILNNGTYKLPNGSNVWASFNAATPALDFESIGSLEKKGSTLYQSNRNGVYYYNGTSWILIASQTGVGNALLNENFNSFDHLVVSGSGNQVFVVFSSKNTNQGKIYYSNNATSGPWTLISSSQINQSIWALKAVSGGVNVFAGYDKSGVYRSGNSGGTWAFSNGNLTISPGLSFVRGDINASLNKRYFVADGSPYLFYSDYGSSWTQQLLNSCSACLFSTVHKQTNGDLLAIGNQTYRSTDDGTNWSDIGGPPVYLEKVVPGSSTTYYGYNYTGGVHSYYKSSVATAATWAIVGPITTGLPVSYQVLKIASDLSSNLYLLLDSGPTKLYKVAGGVGTNATEITNTQFGSQIYNIQSFGGDLYVLGYNSTDNQYQIAKTTNGGTSWTRTNVRSLDDFFIVNASVIVGREEVGNNSDFYYSNDAGATWTLGFSENKQTSIVGALINTDPGYNGVLDICIFGAPNYRSDSPILRPNAPSNLQSVGSGNSLVVLEWDHDGLYLQDFEISRRLQGGTTFTVLETFLGASSRYYEDDEVVPGTNYEYQIIAKSPAGNSSSPILSVTSGATCALTIPDNRSWTGTVPGGFTNATIGIQKQSDSYTITDFTAGSLNTTIGQAIIAGEFYENCGSPFIKPTNNVYPNGGGTWNPTTKTLTLNFQVNKNQYTPTEKTITLVLNTNDPAPAKPLNVSALVLDNTSIEIKWTPGLYQNDYVIERAIGSGAYSSIGAVNYPTTSFTDNAALVVGTTYSYRVRARNNNAVPLENLSDPTSLVFRRPNFILTNTAIANFSAFTVSAQWADFNNDGFQDYITLNFNTTSQKFETIIFKNLGTGDFQQITPVFENKAYLIPSLADYNNDGFTDIGFGIDEFASLDLYKGNGDFTFSLASPSEIGDLASSALSENLASWADINNDGLLDLFLWSSTQKRLFKQNSNHSFSLITGGALATDVIRTSSGLWADFNNDGFQDLLLTNEDGILRLYRNNGNETFTLTTGTGFDAIEATSAAWGDYNNDGHPDLFTSNQGGYALYKNNGNSTFTKDVSTSISTQIVNPSIGAASWGDFNNDGYLDLLTASFNIPASLYIRVPGSSVAFTKISDEKVNDLRTSHYGHAHADYDENGFLDLAFSSFEFSEIGDTFLPSTSNLFKNNNTSGSWTLIKLKPGNGNNKDAIGAKVTVTTSGGNYYREIASLSSLVSRNATPTHFGLGSATSITNILVRWPNGTLQNYPNPPINQVLTITEDAQGPGLVLQVPAVGATNVNSNTAIEITFNEPPLAVAGKKITITPTGGTAIVLDVSAGVIMGNKVTFTLPANLTASTQHNVTVDAGAFTDIYANATAAISSGWSFTTDAGPSILSFSPANSASNVAVNIPIELTFDRNVTPVPGKKIKVLDGTTVVVDIDVSTTGTITGAKYSLPAAAGGWPFLKALSVLVDAGAFVDANQNSFAGLIAGQYSFTIIEAADVTKPVFGSFAPPASLNKGFGTNLFALDITDNKAVTSAKIFVRSISGSAFTETAGTFNITSGKWELSLAETSFDAMGAQYYFEAKDAANNTARSPDGTAFHQTYLKYVADLQIPDAVVGVGGKKTDWKVIAIPFDLPNGGIATVFEELKDKVNTVDYRLLTYKDDLSWAEYPSSELSVFTRGKGYFINLKTQIPLTLGTNLVAPNNTRGNLFGMSLKKGWNMIGNPYNTPISWTDVATLNSLTGTSAQLKQYGSGTYTVNNALPAFAGGFVFVDNDVTVSIPFAGQTSIGGRTKGEEATGKDNWILPITLKQNEIENGFGGIGMKADAAVSFDQFDDINPPRFFDYVEMNFDHPEHFAKKFSRDVVPAQPEYTWEFTVSSNLQGATELRWPVPFFGENKMQLFLLDVTRQVLVNMSEHASYTFDAQAPNKFKIYYGENLEGKVTPNRVTLGQATPNPTTRSTSISFTLPHYAGKYLVNLEVFDLLGRKITTLAEGEFSPGFYQRQWNDTEELTDGLYTYRLSVVAGKKREVFGGRVVLKR